MTARILAAMAANLVLLGMFLIGLGLGGAS